MAISKYLKDLNKWYHSIHANRDWANLKIVKNIEEQLGLTFVAEPFDEGNVCMANSPEVRDDYRGTFTPNDLRDYIYAVLHSTSYREKYKESSKIDFSSISYPKDVRGFWSLVDLGRGLQQLPQSETPRLVQEIDTIETV